MKTEGTGRTGDLVVTDTRTTKRLYIHRTNIGFSVNGILYPTRQDAIKVAKNILKGLISHNQ